MNTKRSPYLALLGLAAGFSGWQSRQVTIYAASSEIRSSAAQTPAHGGPDTVGSASYLAHCAICHGDQREGNLPGFPPLLGVGRRFTNSQITDLIHGGKGRMPAFPKLQNEELTALLQYLQTTDLNAAAPAAADGSVAAVHETNATEIGGPLFQQNCAFCHGRDAGGGESGPDLTRSKLVLADRDGDKISEVVRNGRIEKKMPAFNFSQPELLSLASFLHSQVAKAVAKKGSRRGVDVSDLQTGDVEAGKRYFNGDGSCAKCHSATGDLAGIASRYEGLQLEERMLYPRDVKKRAIVTLPSGERIAGVLAYHDEFTVALRDAEGSYRSWSTGSVKYSIASPVDAHVDQFSKYTDDDIHNLMAYLQTLR